MKNVGVTMEQRQDKEDTPIAFNLEITLLEGIFKDNVVRITEEDVSELKHALEMLYTLATFGVFTRKCNDSDAFDHPSKAYEYIREYASRDAEKFLPLYRSHIEAYGYDAREPVRMHIRRFSQLIGVIVHPVYNEDVD